MAEKNAKEDPLLLVQEKYKVRDIPYLWLNAMMTYWTDVEASFLKGLHITEMTPEHIHLTLSNLFCSMKIEAKNFNMQSLQVSEDMEDAWAFTTREMEWFPMLYMQLYTTASILKIPPVGVYRWLKNNAEHGVTLNNGVNIRMDPDDIVFVTTERGTRQFGLPLTASGGASPVSAEEFARMEQDRQQHERNLEFQEQMDLAEAIRQSLVHEPPAKRMKVEAPQQPAECPRCANLSAKGAKCEECKRAEQGGPQ